MYFVTYLYSITGSYINITLGIYLNSIWDSRVDEGKDSSISK